jgi:hypothetical protein
MVRILKKRLIISLLLAGLLISGCGKKDDNEQNQEQEVSINQILTDSNVAREVELSDLEELKGFLPTKLIGMKRKDSSVELSQIKDIDIIQAEADYVADSGGGTVNITIIDGAKLEGIAKLALTAWTLSQFNRENANGYERTIRYKNFNAMEKYDNNNRDGVFRVYVAERFIIEVEGNQVNMETIKEAVDKIDVTKLAALATGS